MEVQEALQKRRSIRKYTDEPVSREDIDVLMHAAMSGPSAVNRMPWEFYAVSNPDILNKLQNAARFSKMNAPLAIVVCGNKSRMLPMQLEPYWVQDCSAATENILLAAVDLGLGSVWCGIYPQKKAAERVSEALGLPDKIIPLNIIYIGHPAEEQPARDQYKDKYVHIIE